MMEPLLRKKGWFQSLGMDSVGAAGARRRNRRLWTIYNTNMKTTVSADRWAQTQRLQNNGVDMYFEYIQTTSENARSEHLLWVGTILPMTHTFCNKAYPPNGWWCKCSVATHTKYSLQSKKLQAKNAPELIEVDWLNKHTGKVQNVTLGIDPAFDYNVGFGYDKNYTNNNGLFRRNACFSKCKISSTQRLERLMAVFVFRTMGNSYRVTKGKL